MIRPAALSDFLAAQDPSVLVEIAEAKGSTPREEGAFMLVTEAALLGTIGGGQLEYLAIDNARALLAGKGQAELDIPLGPEIGQCCGGRTRLVFHRLTAERRQALLDRLMHEEAALPHVYLFGAGHVGQALAAALQVLPLQVSVVETRAEALAPVPHGIRKILTPMPESLVAQAPAGTALVILTHDHALDFLIAREALARRDLAYIGMIGSATKRASLAAWLRRETGGAEAMSQLTLPIGGTAVRDKRPAVIAALTAAEILSAMAAWRDLPDRALAHRGSRDRV